ncbi:MAG: hypothetical protein WBC91_13670 [Phototrophicaceae bacterium]
MKFSILKLTLILVFGFLLTVSSAAQDNDPPVDTDGDTIVIDTEQAANTIIAVTESTAEGISQLIAQFLNRLFSISQNQYVQVVMVIAGVILLFAGWRIYNWIIVLASALIGGTFALAAVGNDAGIIIEVAAFIIGAVIGGALGYFLYYFAVFMVGAYIGIVFTTLIAQSFGLLPLAPLVLIIIAVIGGIIMVALSFELLVVLASLLGAQLIVLALVLTPTLFWLVTLTLIGIVLQISLTRRAGYSVRRRPSRRMIF